MSPTNWMTAKSHSVHNDIEGVVGKKDSSASSSEEDISDSEV